MGDSQEEGRKAKRPKEKVISPYGGEKLSKWVFGLALADVAISAPVLCSSLFQAHMIDRMVKGDSPSDVVIAISDVVQGVLGVAELALTLPFFVLFLLWLRRMYQNLEYLGYIPRFQPGWAIGSFFVPLLNLVRPFQIVREVMDESDQSQKPPKWFDRTLIVVWWIVLLASSLLGRLMLRAALHGNPTVQELQSQSWNFVWADLIDCLLAPLFVLLIVRVRDKQERATEEKKAASAGENSLINKQP